MTAEAGNDRPPGGATEEERSAADDGGSRTPVFDRHLVLDQLGGWRGMVDATLPTVAFIVANSLGGLRVGIWSALGAALLVFLLRMARRESIQQAVSGLFAVGVAVAIAAYSGQARDFYVVGIIRNVGIGLLLLGSVLVRWPLVGVIAEFLAPSHLGAMATTTAHPPGMRGRLHRASAVLQPAERDPDTGTRAADPAAECHWRDDRRLVRAYGWLTVLWGAVFLLRAAITGPLYFLSEDDDATALGVVSLLLGIPVTVVELAVTLWVIARLHRHRAPALPPRAA
ncbi:DUF3159 domain-containing protein [Trujillonella endophytica]|uniref:DUF3159 domain-containing protein n=1 Tax=Trujillonella endophytica TaxID=673521 RepID=A0A1H8PCE2_9ACTN|nr:DUF3159 domain-containing protein [Trujillella endophytica]SEO39620.1 Protein of unknown function [Trujillella endophytica]